jgi:transglutaminase-like putative cysteine protease
VPDRIELWVTSEPGPAGEVFVPTPFLGTMTETPLHRDRAGNLRVSRHPRGPITISAVTWLGSTEYPAAAGPRLSGGLYQVPPHLLQHPAFRKAVRAVRRRVAEGQSLALAVSAHVRETFRYTRTPKHDPDADPILEFLRTGRGFCQHYASLAAMLLRAEGIPCRIGAGLAFGVLRDGAWTYGLENGHAWVELWLDGIGWVPLDPTAGTTNLDTGLPTPSGIGPAPGFDGASGAVEPDVASDRPGQRDGSAAPSSGADREAPGRGRPAPGPVEPPQSSPARRGEAAARPVPPSKAASEPEGPAEVQGRAVAPEPTEASAADAQLVQPPDTPGSGGSGADATSDGAPASPGLVDRLLQLDLQAALQRALALGDWLMLGCGALLCTVALAALRRRVHVEEALGERPGADADAAAADLAALRERLAVSASPRLSAQLLFELFSRQMAAWGYGRARHETERDYALAVGKALGDGGHAAMDAAVTVVEETRYGGTEPSPPQLAQLDRSLAAVLRDLGRRLGVKPHAALRSRGGWLHGTRRVVG